MNSRYGKPSTTLIRCPRDNPNTRMNRLDETIGASTVWVQSFDTRNVSRFTSQVRPRVPVTVTRLLGAPSLGSPAVHDPISYGQAVILGLTQGIAEPFPISSLGHGVIIPRLLGWDIHQKDKFFITFLVATHLATAIVLFFFFLKDWMRIFRGLGRSLRDREIAPGDNDARLGWLLVVGTIPAGLLGVLLEGSLRSVFASAASAAAFLILNGILLLFFERL